MAEVVGAMLVRDSAVLLGLRAAHKSFAGQWDIIGGHIEQGESKWSALRRELVEEIGVECVAASPLGILNIAHGRQFSSLHVYCVSSWKGKPSIRNDEHTEIRWFELNAAAQLPNLVSPQYRPMFTSLSRTS